MNTMKTVMILGGGYYQLPLIEKSVELGFRTIVCGIAGNYPGYALATKWYDVDTFNRDACLQIAKAEHIDGIITTGTDQMLPTIGYIVDELKLPGSGLAPTILSSNKAKMKEAFVKNGVRTAEYRLVADEEECLSAALAIGFPVVLKIVDGSGSRGVAVAHSETELYEYYPKIKAETKQPQTIVEKFVDGEEFGAQAFVRDGKLTMVMPHGDITYHGVTDVPVGHYAPYEHAEVLMADIKEQLEKSIVALGIDNTAINADFILSDGKVFVLELGARAGATCLPELVSCYYGENYYEYLLRNCIGEKVAPLDRPVAASWVETLTTQKCGEVKTIGIPEMPAEVVDFQLYPKEGDIVRPFRTAYDRIGTIVIKGSSLASVKNVRDAIMSNITIEVN